MTDWNTFYKDQYRFSVDGPIGWCSCAQMLMIAAEAALARAKEQPRDQLKVWPVYMMLYGLAIENLIKGLYASSQGALSENGEKVRPEVTIHIGMADLAMKADVELTDEHKALIERLELYVNGWGKYPAEKTFMAQYLGLHQNDLRIPASGKIKKNSQEILKSFNGAQSPTVSNYFDWANDPKTIKELYDYLDSLLRSISRNWRPKFTSK